MKKINWFLFTFIFSAIAFYSGCDDTGTEVDNQQLPDSDLSFRAHIQPIIEVKCNSSGCHDDGSRAGGLSLTSWVNVTADASIVFPGEPQNSKLVWAIEGQAGIQPMPPIGYAPLTPQQIRAIKTWIDEGAKNN